MNRIRNSYYGVTRTCFAATTTRISCNPASNNSQPNIPLAVTEVQNAGLPFGSGPNRGAFNFLYFPWAMTTVQNITTASNVGGVAGWQWATSDAGPWSFVGDGVRDVVPLNPTTAGFRAVGFFISSALRYAGNVVLRPVTLNGDGIADPVWGNQGIWASHDVASGFFPLTGGIDVPMVPINPSCTVERRNQGIFSNWNSGGVQWLNQPAALTEYLGTTASRLTTNLLQQTWKTNWVDWNMRINVPGASGTTRYSLQASLDGGGTWQYLDGVDSPFRIINPAGTAMTTIVPLLTAIRFAASFILRVVGINGNAVADPTTSSSSFNTRYYHIDPTGAH